MPYYLKPLHQKKSSWNNGGSTLRTIGGIIFFLVILLVVLLIGMSLLSWLFGINFGSRSDALREIQILGCELTKPSEFFSVVNLAPGKSLSTINFKESKILMERLRWVQAVDIRVDRFRGKIELNVTERKPLTKVIIDQTGTTQWLCNDATLQPFLTEDKTFIDTHQLINLPVMKFKDPLLNTDEAKRKSVLEIIDLADQQAKGQVKEIIFEPRSVVNLICTYGTLVKLGNNPNRANQFAILPKALRKVVPIYNRQIIIDLTAGLDPTDQKISRSYYRYVWLPEYLHNQYGQEELTGKSAEALKANKSNSNKSYTSNASRRRSSTNSSSNKTKRTSSLIPPKPRSKSVTPNYPRPKIKTPKKTTTKKSGGIPPPPSGM